MHIIVPVTDARASLSKLVDKSDEQDVVLTRRGRPAAVLISVERHAALMEEMEDLEDKLSIYKHLVEGGETVPFEDVVAELGLDDEER